VAGSRTEGGVVKDVGRPRHFDPDTERSMLLRAARRLLRTRRYGDVTLSAILEESKLHTRAFYRHFPSKEELFLTIYRENGESLHGILAGRVEGAGSPRDGVIAWIDEMLRLHFDPRSAAHVSAYKEVAEAVNEHEVVERSVARFLEPLRGALAAGRKDGTLPNAEPDVHAAVIWSLVWNDLHWADRGRPEQRWAKARQLLVSFVMTGLGGAPPSRS